MLRPTMTLAQAGAGSAFFTSSERLLARLGRRLARLHASSASSPAEAESSASAELRWLLASLNLPSTPRLQLSKSPSRRRLISLVQRRTRLHEPLAYVLGDQPFGSLPASIKVRPPTLIPRPETEEWTIDVGERLAGWVAANGKGKARRRDEVRILDLCSGSGCIALLVAHHIHEALERPASAAISVQITAADVSHDALRLIAENAKLQGFDEVPGAHRFHLDRTFQRGAIVLRVRHVDLFDDAGVETLLSEGSDDVPLDLILSNPPYIPLAEHAKLDDDVRKWEDPLALVGVHPRQGKATAEADDGLFFYRRIAELCGGQELLRSDPLQHKDAHDATHNVPSLVVEVGHGQADQVIHLLKRTGRFACVEGKEDAWGIMRSVWAWM